MVALGLLALHLQLYYTGDLARLFFVRIFFQVVLAATVIAAMKNVLGIRTIGSFAPVIVALAFLATGLPIGLGLFLGVLGVVLLTRASLHRERIVEPHRVAILITMVSVAITLVALLGLLGDLHVLFFAVLFPILITAWLAERYVEQVTRVGWRNPTKSLAWTLGAIMVSFVAMAQDPLVTGIQLNPLTWPLLVLLNWLLGTRVRFRLSERFRFLGVRRYGLDDDGFISGQFSGNVLTMVVRNREFIQRYNPPEAMASFTKAEAKRRLVPQGIPMARTYMVVARVEQLRDLEAWLGANHRFALKPASGFGGEGILLIQGKGPGGFQTNRGIMGQGELLAHARQILEGAFNLGRQDQVVVEELLSQHGDLGALVPEGLADIRVICFLGYPIMAMARLPTKASGGKANLHLGAVGAGIRLSTGVIVHSTWKGKPTERHPDTGLGLVGFRMPAWREILEVAVEAQRVSGLGYAGVDVALDSDHGPVVMEVNRRPGLEIQNVNLAGLLKRLRLIESLPPWEAAVEDRVDLAMALDVENWERLPAPLARPIVTSR